MENNCTSFLEERFETFIPNELPECINGALIRESFTYKSFIGEVRLALFVTIQPRVELECFLFSIKKKKKTKGRASCKETILKSCIKYMR